MLHKLRNLLPVIISIAVIIGFAVYLAENADRYKALLDFSVGSLIWLVILTVLGRLCYAGINYILYHLLDAPVTFNESFGLAAINSLANYLPFSGGMIAKGVYLKKRYQLAYTYFLSVTLALYLFFLSANGVTGAVVLAYMRIFEEESISPIVVAGFWVMAGSILFLFLPLHRIPVKESLQVSINRLLQGWLILKRNRRAILGLVVLQVMTTLLYAVRLMIVFQMLSQKVMFEECLLFSAATVLSQLVAFTPGGLGIRELIVAGIASTVQIEPDISVVATGLDRLVETAVILTLGAFYTYTMGKDIFVKNNWPSTPDGPSI